MVQYRTFRNTDPPRLVELWNQTFTGRGAVYLRNSTPFERLVYSKPFFDPAGLFIAENDNKLVGFAHAGMAPSLPMGATCVIGVRPDHHNTGVGSELLRRCEQYLRKQGAQTFFGGCHWPVNPFYLGLYGGSDSPGILQSDQGGEAFFRKHGYTVQETILVFQAHLKQPVKMTDIRCAVHRSRFAITSFAPRKLDGYWHECTFGALEPVTFCVEDRKTGAMVGRSLLWEMDGFSERWGAPAVGIVGFEVHPDFRRTGVGKYLLTSLLKQVQEQFFEIAEVQISQNNQLAIPFLRELGFDIVDCGQVFAKPVD